MRRLALAVALAVALLCVRQADARTVAALAPVATFTGERAAAAEDLLSDAIDSVADHVSVRAERVREILRRASRRDLEACEGENGCLAELGRLCGAAVVLYGEVGSLAGDRVLYLKAVDVARRAERGSTTVVLHRDDAPRAARAAATQLLAPEAYTGVLEVKVDVEGAAVYVDGKPAGRSPMASTPVPVGTHALRVTHPRYRDFVRFVDVRFEERTAVDTNLEAYPLVGDSLVAGGARRRFRGSVWLVAGVGAAVFVAAAVVAFVIPRSIERDREVTVGGSSQ